MKRTTTSWITLALLAALAAPAVAQNQESLQDRLERIRQRAEEARNRARNQPTATATTTATTPPPPPTTTATATATAAPTTTATATTAAADAAAPPPPKPKSVVGVVLAGIEELRRTRIDRRRVEVEGLRQRWGQLLLDERARSELRLHATRIAYLQRIRAVANQVNDQKLVAQVDQLITKEERRNSDAMNAFRTSAPAPAVGAAR